MGKSSRTKKVHCCKMFLFPFFFLDDQPTVSCTRAEGVSKAEATVPTAVVL